MSNLLNSEGLDAFCPSCGSQDLEVFYEISNVPVHSCLMLATQEEAMAFPCGDIRLGFCHRCGFIYNLDFDPQWSAYAPNYEDQQSYSPTFSQFALDLAQHLIDKYQLQHKRVLEIGCGKGDFLHLLCELGKNHGVGIDPAAKPGRVQSAAADRITFIPDYYSDRYAHLLGDFICCRHTLEHIQPVADFLRRLRVDIGEHQSIPLFFEVPDTTRILRDLAFEDIYYEHCSYFTHQSLSYLFQACGFDVMELYTAYDDQYLLIEAKPSPVHQPPTDEGLQPMMADVHRFKQQIQVSVFEMRSHLKTLQAQNKRIAIWGSGSKCVSFLTTLGATDLIHAVVDINPHRHGKFIPGLGHQIISPDALRADPPDVVIIMNPLYQNEIQTMLTEMDISAEVMALGQWS